MANLRPLILGFLVRREEGGLRNSGVLHRGKGGLRSSGVLHCGEGGLRSGEPITLCDAAFSSFLLLLCFFVF